MGSDSGYKLTPVSYDPFPTGPSLAPFANEPTLSPYSPSWSETIGNWGADAMRAITGDKYKGQEFGQRVQAAASLVPGVGNALSGNEAARAYGRGDYFSAGLNALAAVPIVPGAGGVVEEAAAPTLRAFHGSPHSFSSFDSSKIGTGEGSQVFGHGHYLAENQSTAESYRPEGGHMYEVGVATNPDHFLDWDKPLSEQHPKVQEAMKALGVPFEEDWGLSNKIGGEAPKDIRPVQGSSAYLKAGETPQDAANALKEAGIPGIKYLDAGSRNSGSGTRNYVVFDPNTISILKKYGIAGLGLGGAAAVGSQSQPTPAEAATSYKLTPAEHDPFP